MFYKQQHQSRIHAVKIAIHNYFNYCHDAKARELRQLLQTGRISLAIALVFLGTCITIDNLISSWFGGTIVKILHEGLFIVGWVAMWRPIEIFLYDWVPITYGRLRQRTRPTDL